jgi:hypothetical protein
MTRSIEELRAAVEAQSAGMPAPTAEFTKAGGDLVADLNVAGIYGWFNAGWMAAQSEASNLNLELLAALEAAHAENAVLRAAMAPFARIVRESSGRIPTERLSLANWHALTKAAVTATKEVTNG